MLGWLIIALTTILSGHYGRRSKPRQTISAQMRRWRDQDEVGLWIIWISGIVYLTWHFFFRDEPEV